uniref:Uncharacterized protein n=1 Tax=Arabidopsis thaliana TaxID=3702 RepID=Q8GYI2_ARATH|nr:unknown protein [Arabidopsis thaliana]
MTAIVGGISCSLSLFGSFSDGGSCDGVRSCGKIRFLRLAGLVAPVSGCWRWLCSQPSNKG